MQQNLTLKWIFASKIIKFLKKTMNLCFKDHKVLKKTMCNVTYGTSLPASPNVASLKTLWLLKLGPKNYPRKKYIRQSTLFVQSARADSCRNSSRPSDSLLMDVSRNGQERLGKTLGKWRSWVRYQGGNTNCLVFPSGCINWHAKAFSKNGTCQKKKRKINRKCWRKQELNGKCHRQWNINGKCREKKWEKTANTGENEVNDKC